MAGEEAGGSTRGEHGLSSADHVQEPNCPKSSGSSGKGWGCVGHGGQEHPVVAVQGTAWKKAGAKAGRPFGGSRHRQQRSDGSSFKLAPNAFLAQHLAWHRVDPVHIVTEMKHLLKE